MYVYIFFNFCCSPMLKMSVLTSERYLMEYNLHYHDNGIQVMALLNALCKTMCH